MRNTVYGIRKLNKFLLFEIAIKAQRNTKKNLIYLLVYLNY
jgi:hypothetical protein